MRLRSFQSAAVCKERRVGAAGCKKTLCTALRPLVSQLVSERRRAISSDRAQLLHRGAPRSARVIGSSRRFFVVKRCEPRRVARFPVGVERGRDVWWGTRFPTRGTSTPVQHPSVVSYNIRVWRGGHLDRPRFRFSHSVSLISQAFPTSRRVAAPSSSVVWKWYKVI